MKKTALCLILFLLSFAPVAQAYEDITDTFAHEDTAKLRTFLAACADITSYDSKNYDYDTLFKYVLYTNENFRVLTDIDPQTTISSAPGSGDVFLVKGEFIDYIMDTVFHIVPEKPNPSSLTSRGFCYANGYYMFTGGFNVFFATDIVTIDNVYDIGSDTLLVTFTDIYTEGSDQRNESSYAIVHREDYGYSLLKLGMGKPTPSFDEANEYFPGITNSTPPPPQQNKAAAIFLPILLLICAIAICGSVVSIIKIAKIKN